MSIKKGDVFYRVDNRIDKCHVLERKAKRRINMNRNKGIIDTIIYLAIAILILLNTLQLYKLERDTKYIKNYLIKIENKVEFYNSKELKDLLKKHDK